MTITLQSIPSNTEGQQQFTGNPIRDPGGNYLVERNGGTLHFHLTSPADGTINTDINQGAIVSTPLVGPWRACTPGLPVVVVVSSYQTGALYVEDSADGSTVSTSRLVGPPSAEVVGNAAIVGAAPVTAGGAPQGCRFTTDKTWFRVRFVPFRSSFRVNVCSQQRAA